MEEKRAGGKDKSVDIYGFFYLLIKILIKLIFSIDILDILI